MHITAEGMELDTLVSSNGPVIQYGDIKLPKRYVIVANHQLSNDFMFLWLLSYYGKRVGGMMGLLLDNLKHVPLFGWMLEFFDFVFMHRNWKHDGSRLMTRVRKLATGWEREEELAFFVFPEGALLTDKWREKMQQFAMKNNITRLPERTLLPHVTGLYTVLDNLRDSNVDYLYDVTIAYEGLYSHETPSEVYSIARQYWYRGYPKGVHLRVRRWHIPTEVPIDAGQEVFGQWLMDRWLEKDAMLKRFYATGSMALGATPEERQAETVICPSHPRSYLVESMPFVALVALYGAVCWGLWNAILMLF
ncbi:hypothetical protein BDF22DRAFT_653053 [Syncephalis plumigaleata]|nr:hypothetical protein BDF22DRAFT_653053 [Syncephalis plumigaleata]